MDNITVCQNKECKSFSTQLYWSIALFSLILLASASVVSALEVTQSTISSGSLAVLPFVKGDYTEQFRSKSLSPLVCPIDQYCPDLSEGDESTIIMKNLDKKLHRMLKKKLAGKVFPVEETETQYNMISVDPTKDTRLSIALTLAKKMGSDYILVPILWDVSQRIGNSLAVIEPASVSFSLYLVSAKEAKRIWNQGFTKKQQSLTDNILNAGLFKFGGKWVTAEDLAQAGMAKILEKSPLRVPNK